PPRRSRAMVCQPTAPGPPIGPSKWCSRPSSVMRTHAASTVSGSVVVVVDGTVVDVVVVVVGAAVVVVVWPVPPQAARISASGATSLRKLIAAEASRGHRLVDQGMAREPPWRSL